MEHKAIQWLGAPSCQRGSYAFYKSVSSRARPEGPVQVWKLGEFYFIRCGPHDPVCIAEVTLLWEDQTRRHLLASARLYFLPEDTPKGRSREHGEDEVLAVSRKMVVRVEDLVQWSCSEPAGWRWAPSCGTNGFHKPRQNDLAERSSEPLRDRTPNGVPDLRGVKVLSYPQYCRFRSLQRRIQDRARDPGLQDPHLLALGGVRVQSSTRLMYCRDTFNHPTLEGSTGFSWSFRCPSLSLRGRPRKKKGRDSRDSPSSVQSESWIERMKENVMGSVEDGCEGDWLPHPEEQLFLDQLYGFMERHGSPIHKVPNLGFKKIDLFLLFSVVKRLGGYKKVTSDRQWKLVYNELGGCPGSTSAATCTRRHYERLMLPYEDHLRGGGVRRGGAATGGGGGGEGAAGGTATGAAAVGGGGGTAAVEGGEGAAAAATEFKIPESPVAHKSRGIRGRKPLPRGRKQRGGVNAAMVKGFGSSVVKRGRGRPPGARNKSTVTTQAKLQQVQPSSLSPPPPRPAPPSVLLSTLPRHFSPIKGLCPLDVFRGRVSLQRSPESPGLAPQVLAHPPPTIYTLQPSHQAGDQHPQRCSGCDEGGQRGGCRGRSPMPPLRVLPLNLDCSVQVCQLMRTRRLDSSQLQTFTRRLSEALSQDLSPPATAPPEQALPLNLSRRFAAKRPPPQGAELFGEQALCKHPRSSEDGGPVGGEGGGGGGGEGAEAKQQEEPADLSSPSRIRAFLLGLPPFQVKLEEDLNGMRKFLPAGSDTETRWADSEREGVAGAAKETQRADGERGGAAGTVKETQQADGERGGAAGTAKETRRADGERGGVAGMANEIWRTDGERGGAAHEVALEQEEQQKADRMNTVRQCDADAGAHRL